MLGLQNMGMDARRIQLLAEESIRFTFANAFRNVGLVYRPHSQIQSYGAITAVYGLQSMGINAFNIELLSEERIGVAFAYIVSNSGLVNRPQAQVQNDGTIATMYGLQGVRVDSLRIELLSKERIGVAFTDVIGDIGLVCRPNIQVQNDGTIAAVYGLQGMCMDARSVELLAQEGICFAFTNVC